MPYIEIADDWPKAMAGWDAARVARHAGIATRFVAAGWRANSASLIAFDLMREEDEAEAVTTPKETARVKGGANDDVRPGRV